MGDTAARLRMWRLFDACLRVLRYESAQHPKVLLTKADQSEGEGLRALLRVVRFIVASLEPSTLPAASRSSIFRVFIEPKTSSSIVSSICQIVGHTIDVTGSDAVGDTLIESLVEGAMPFIEECDPSQNSEAAFNLLSLPIVATSPRLITYSTRLFRCCVPFLERFGSNRGSELQSTSDTLVSGSFFQKATGLIRNLIKIGPRRLAVDLDTGKPLHVITAAIRFVVWLIEYDLESTEKRLEMDDMDIDDSASEDEERVFPLSSELMKCIDALDDSSGETFFLAVTRSILDDGADPEGFLALSSLLYVVLRSRQHSSRRRLMLLSFALSGNLVERLWREQICPMWIRMVQRPDSSEMDKVMGPLAVLCEIYSTFLRTAGKREVCQRQIPLKLTDVYDSDSSCGGLVNVLKNSIWDAIWTRPAATTYRIPSAIHRDLVVEFPRICGQLLVQLSENSSRWELTPPELFHMQSAQISIFVFKATSSPLSKSSEDEEQDIITRKSIRVLKHAPCLIPFHERTKIFQGFLDAQRSQRPMTRRTVTNQNVHARISRRHLFADGFEQLGRLNREELRSKIRVEFVDAHGLMEAGVDGGGLFKDFLENLVKEGFNVDTGYFAMTDQHELYPNPAAVMHDFDALDVFAFLGRMLGKAVYDGILLELPFAHFFLKKVLRLSCDLHDMPSFDQEVYDGLVRLRSDDWDESEIGLTFTIADNVRGKNNEVELKHNGRCIPVTRQNVVEYIFRFADYRLNKELKKTSQRFVDGFLEVIEPEWIEMFNAAELKMVISGTTQRLDLLDLRQNTRYLGGYTDDQPIMQYFWEIMDDFSSDEQGRFLKFVTGCSRAPLLGFERLQPNLAIQRIESSQRDVERLPTAATCMNLLKLPEYNTKRILREKLIYAISSNAGFNLS